MPEMEFFVSSQPKIDEIISETPKSLMHILDESGDLKVIWDSKNVDEVAAARDQFNNLLKKGFLAFSVKQNGEAKEQIHEFDPDAEKLIMVPAVVGG